MFQTNLKHLGKPNVTAAPVKNKFERNIDAVMMYNPITGRGDIPVPAYLVEEKKLAGLITMAEKIAGLKEVTYVNIVNEICRGIDGNYTVQKCREIDLPEWIATGWEIYDKTRHLPSNPMLARSYQAAEVGSEYIVPEKVVVPEPPTSHAGRKKIH